MYTFLLFWWSLTKRSVKLAPWVCSVLNFSALFVTSYSVHGQPIPKLGILTKFDVSSQRKMHHQQSHALNYNHPGITQNVCPPLISLLLIRWKLANFTDWHHPSLHKSNYYSCSTFPIILQRKYFPQRKTPHFYPFASCACTWQLASEPFFSWTHSFSQHLHLKF